LATPDTPDTVMETMMTGSKERPDYPSATVVIATEHVPPRPGFVKTLGG
jgi:hypothetical protein